MIERLAQRLRDIKSFEICATEPRVEVSHDSGRRWMQVSWDWRLDSTVLFKAISYLDNYLQQRQIPVLNK